MSNENSQCYWTAVPRADPPHGEPPAYWYVMDVDGKMEFTQDVTNAVRFNIDSPHDKGLINAALEAKGLHMTMKVGPRLSLDGLEFSIDEYPDVEETATDEEVPAELNVTIEGRQDAVLILARLIAQNQVLLLGTEEKQLITDQLQRVGPHLNQFNKRVTIRIIT